MQISDGLADLQNQVQYNTNASADLSVSGAVVDQLHKPPDSSLLTNVMLDSPQPQEVGTRHEHWFRFLQTQVVLLIDSPVVLLIDSPVQSQVQAMPLEQ